jgi:tRNA nucleotidyltransferase (CCA-adding enzyme)
MQKLKTEILKKIKPSKREQKELERIVKKITYTVKEVSGLESMIVGSTSKHTWLSGKHDIDVFVLFDKKTSRKELEERGLEIGKQVARAMNSPFVIKYAEHPYVQAKVNGYKVDIVPAYKIKKGEKIKSAVDRSPLHLEFILKNLDPGLRDDVRLLKQFCKGIGVYGSDVKTLGISGYVCELLVLNYGPFEDVLKAISQWATPVFIDVTEKKPRIRRKKRFKNQPLVLLDPTDPDRNTAAALSPKNFIKLRHYARMFLELPSERFFFPPKPKPLSEEELGLIHKRGTKFLAIKMPKPDLLDDILYPQVRKLSNRLNNLLKRNEFYSIRSKEWINEDIMVIFELETWALPFIKKMRGPSIFSRKHSNEFLTKYRGVEFRPYLEDIFWAAEKEREFKSAHELFLWFLGLKEEEMREKGVPKNLAKSLKQAQLLEHDMFWKMLKENKDFSAFLRKEYFGNEFG